MSSTCRSESSRSVDHEFDLQEGEFKVGGP
jgi:hypothetical protein